MNSVNNRLRATLVDWLYKQVPTSVFQCIRSVEPISHPSTGDKLVGWWVESDEWEIAAYLLSMLTAHMSANRIDSKRHSLLLEPWGGGYRIVVMVTSPRAPRHVLPMGVIEAEGR